MSDVQKNKAHYRQKQKLILQI